MITHKGLPAPLVCDFLSREASRASGQKQVEDAGRYTFVISCPQQWK